jgi:hypothetical protein
MSLIQYVVVLDSETRGTLYRRGVKIGPCNRVCGDRWEHARGYTETFDYRTIPAVAGEPSAATYSRVEVAMGPELPRPSHIRPLLRTVCRSVA